MFRTGNGQRIPGVTERQMREIDRIAMQEFGLGVFQMMENAGRSLALHVMEMLGASTGEVAILAGTGGNGGGGLCCARHLQNRGIKVHLILDRERHALRDPALTQWQILEQAGHTPARPRDAERLLADADIVVDALIGYSLHGAPTGRTAELIARANQAARRLIALDLPSGRNATTGAAPGAVILPERTLTLALPKTGLRGMDSELFVADIGIPPQVYQRLDLHVPPFFGEKYWVSIKDAREERPAP